MARSIHEPWEVTQDRPNPFEPVKFEEINFAPYSNAQEYLKYIRNAIRRDRPIQAIFKFDDFYHMPGHYTWAEIIDGTLWVTFTPEKLGGKYWVSFAKGQSRNL